MTTPLKDSFGRRIEYLRLSVTDRCDLRCFYCLPEDFQDYEEPEHWLTLDEIERVLGLFGRTGVHRVRLTGGEPHKVLDGIMAARHTGFAPIKINMVVMKGINDGEVEDMVDFCIEHGFTLRFIETMPVGDTGRLATDHYLGLGTVRRRLGKRFDLIPAVMQGGGPARYVEVVGSGVNIGFITPISRHFCETCNRVRLSVDGVLYLCLGQDDRLELRPMLRSGATDAEIEQAIRQAILRKPERHHFQQHPEQVIRFMAKTGG